jgi:hypothetical protein
MAVVAGLTVLASGVTARAQQAAQNRPVYPSSTQVGGATVSYDHR